MLVKLSKPVTVGDKTVEEIDLGLDALTGADVEMCVREAVAAKGEPIFLHRIDIEFHAQVASKLSGISRNGLRGLPARDYEALIGPVESFFLGLD